MIRLMRDAVPRFLRNHAPDDVLAEADECRATRETSSTSASIPRYRAGVHTCVWQKKAMQPFTLSVPFAFFATIDL